MNIARQLPIALSLLVAGCSQCSSSTAPTTSTASEEPEATASPPVVASSAAAPRSAGPPLLLEPGKGIGAIHLGMTLAEVEALGLPTRAHPSGRHGPNVRRVGPYRMEFEDGKVASVAVNLIRFEEGIRIGTQDFGQSSGAKDIAAALPGCGAPEERDGGTGTEIECDEGRALIRMHPSCIGWDDAGVCTGYDSRRPSLDVQVRVKAP